MFKKLLAFLVDDEPEPIRFITIEAHQDAINAVISATTALLNSREEVVEARDRYIEHLHTHIETLEQALRSRS